MVSKKVLDGKVLRISAEAECGACGRTIWLDNIDANEGPTAFDAVIAAVCGGANTSVQGGYMLCRLCTRTVDHDPRVPQDRRSTRAEVRRVLKISADWGDS